MIPWLDPALYRDIVRRALDEDIGDGDITTVAIVAPALRAKGGASDSCLTGSRRV